MTIKHIDGNLLDSKADLICHQVNCQGAFGSGVAKAVKDKWPVVCDKYKAFCDQKTKEGYSTHDLLGIVQPVKVNDKQRVVNLFAQDKYGYDGERYTSYDALDTCLKKLKDYCRDKNINSIAFPYGMSSVRGGALWEVVITLITTIFYNTNISIEVWRLKTDQTET